MLIYDFDIGNDYFFECLFYIFRQFQFEKSIEKKHDIV